MCTIMRYIDILIVKKKNTFRWTHFSTASIICLAWFSCCKANLDTQNIHLVMQVNSEHYHILSHSVTFPYISATPSLS